MKIKLLLLITSLLCLCGCQNVHDLDVSDIVSKVGNEITSYNTYHTGFKYYLPSGMSVVKSSLYNDEIESSNYIFYLYADIISYYNKVENDYRINDDAYFSAKLDAGDRQGYIEINLKENNQYLIEIMFNYAKIEVMVDYDDMAIALNYAVSILRSISYNDVVIASLVAEDILSFQDEVYNIFDNTSSDSDYLKWIEEDIYVDPNETMKDTDLIS